MEDIENRLDLVLDGIIGDVVGEVISDKEAPGEAKAIAVAFIHGASAMAAALSGGCGHDRVVSGLGRALVEGALLMSGRFEVEAVRRA